MGMHSDGVPATVCCRRAPVGTSRRTLKILRHADKRCQIFWPLEAVYQMTSLSALHATLD